MKVDTSALDGAKIATFRVECIYYYYIDKFWDVSCYGIERGFRCIKYVIFELCMQKL